MAALELLAPAGSFESLRAAVQNGADAVYLGGGDFNARRNAKNFTAEDLAKAIEYCRIRGCKTYITLNTLLTDRELERAANFVRYVAAAGADAIIVQDIGAARMVKMAAPTLALHASTQMTAHNLEGVKKLAELGFSRVILARELTKYQIAYICKNSPVEIEVFAHGALCMCYSGKCYMSSVIGGRSGNRGLCAQPCRLPYVFGSNINETESYPLSLKELSLAAHVSELAGAGVKCLKIEGRMRRPEYVAAVTAAYSSAVRTGKPPSENEMRAVAAVFSRQGFTDGYFEDKKGYAMFGVREEQDEKENKTLSKLMSDLRETYRDGFELKRVGVTFFWIMADGQPARLAAEDFEGNKAGVEGPMPERANNRETTESDVRIQLAKTGGTPYYAQTVHVRQDGGLALSAGDINAMRRDVLEKLSAVRAGSKKHNTGEYHSGLRLLNAKEPPKFTVSAYNAGQLTPEVLALNPAYVCLPPGEYEKTPDLAVRLKNKNIIPCVTLPQIINDNQVRSILAKLDICSQYGVSALLTGDPGMVAYARARGYETRGDSGLNIFNSQSLKEIKRMGFSCATLSFELSLPQIRDLSKNMDTELIAYGRFPLMITENCVIKNRYGACGYCSNYQSLTDRSGEVFPVVKEFGCRNIILNAHKLFLADKLDDFGQLGLKYLRLCFTTENPRECSSVADSYLRKNMYEPQNLTRGLYYRSVE